MMFPCDVCHQQKDFMSEFKMSVIDAKGKYSRFCRACCNPKTSVPDVYFKGAYFDEAISDQDNPGGRFISSRGEKAALLKKFNLREAGDRVHGATSYDPISARHAQQSLERRK